MQPLAPSPIIIGGKKSRRKGANKSLTAWVKFVKKVAKEEKLPYRDAMMRAKARKDKGEKWMTGGNASEMDDSEMDEPEMDVPEMDMNEGMGDDMDMEKDTVGGRKRRRGTKKRRGSKKRCTRKRCRSKRHHH